VNVATQSPFADWVASPKVTSAPVSVGDELNTKGLAFGAWAVTAWPAFSDRVLEAAYQSLGGS